MYSTVDYISGDYVPIFIIFTTFVYRSQSQKWNIESSNLWGFYTMHFYKWSHLFGTNLYSLK